MFLGKLKCMNEIQKKKLPEKFVLNSSWGAIGDNSFEGLGVWYVFYLYILKGEMLQYSEQQQLENITWYIKLAITTEMTDRSVHGSVQNSEQKSINYTTHHQKNYLLLWIPGFPSAPSSNNGGEIKWIKKNGIFSKDPCYLELDILWNMI